MEHHSPQGDRMTHPHSPDHNHSAFQGRPINGSLLLTVSEAAAALHISRSSIYRLIEAGELAWVQIGSARRVTSVEIHRFIAAHTEAAS
jgi:excisionase family DNA binding protein